MATDAVTSFTIEAFTLLSISILIIFVRTYARFRQVGFRNFEVDDYLMLLVIVPYTVETCLAYVVGAKYHGLTNSEMTDAERLELSLHPESEEFALRVGGSKVQVAGWTMYATVLWVIKGSMCAFYFRLTQGLAAYKTRIYIGMGLISCTYIAVVCCLLFSCQPFERFWQIYPNPGNLCQPAASKLYIFIIVVLNIISDAFLLLIPIPMLWGAKIAKVKKVGLVVLFSGGIFVMVAGLLRCILILKNPVTGPSEGASWACRESFVAVATSNLPMTWGWLRQKLKPFLGSLLSSSGQKYKQGPEPGSIMLGDGGGQTTWHSRQVNSVKSITRQNSSSSNNEIFIHAGEASSDEIIPNKFGGITKEVVFSVSTSPKGSHSHSPA